MSYTTLGQRGFGDETAGLLVTSASTPAALLPSGYLAKKFRPPTASWTTQTWSPPTYTQGTVATRPQLVASPPVMAPPPIVKMPGGGFLLPAQQAAPAPPSWDPSLTTPVCQAADPSIPWLWILLAGAVGGGVGWYVKREMKKKKGLKGAMAA